MNDHVPREADKNPEFSEQRAQQKVHDLLVSLRGNTADHQTSRETREQAVADFNGTVEALRDEKLIKEGKTGNDVRDIVLAKTMSDGSVVEIRVHPAYTEKSSRRNDPVTGQSYISPARDQVAFMVIRSVTPQSETTAGIVIKPQKIWQSGGGGSSLKVVEGQDHTIIHDSEVQENPYNTLTPEAVESLQDFLTDFEMR